MDAELAIAVAKAGGLGSLPAGMLNAEKLRAQVEQFRSATANKPVNLNFFSHKVPVPNNAREHAWREKLKPYYAEFGIDPSAPVPITNADSVQHRNVCCRRRAETRGGQLPLWLAR